MSRAGDLVLACRLRGVKITLEAEQVFLTGRTPDVQELMPRLEANVAAVHAMITNFAYAIPPRAAERH